MREIELCMKYADNCKRCPQNRKCEEEYQKEMEQKSGECGERPSDLHPPKMNREEKSSR